LENWKVRICVFFSISIHLIEEFQAVVIFPTNFSVIIIFWDAGVVQSASVA
jgi:hypothetical protein